MSDTFESDRPRRSRMAGAAAHDPRRADRIGRMLASSIPAHRAYARRLVHEMSPEDSDMAHRAYRETPSSIRGACEREDMGVEGLAAQDEIDQAERPYLLALSRAATGEGGRMLDIREGSPYALSEYLRRWREKRGSKPAPLDVGKNDRLHAEIVEEIRHEAR